METLTFNTTEQALLAAVGILFLIQLLYYFCLYNRIHTRSRAVKRSDIHFSRELKTCAAICLLCWSKITRNSK